MRHLYLVLSSIVCLVLFGCAQPEATAGGRQSSIGQAQITKEAEGASGAIDFAKDGPSATTTNLVIKKQEFQKYIIKEETRLRIDYWKSKAGQDFLAYVDLGKIEELRARLFQLKRNIGELGLMSTSC